MTDSWTSGDGRSASDTAIRLRGEIFQQFALAAAALLLFAFLTWPTIDFDEGYFFQSGVLATITGRPGFPWTNAYYGAPHLYVPLNSLDSLLSWPLAYLPQNCWLLAGRLVSALAVCAGVLVLRRRQPKLGLNPGQAGALLFLVTCLPLILLARTLRPDGLAFLGTCVGLALALTPSRVANFCAGLVVALTALAHAVHGALAGAMVLGMLVFIPALSMREFVNRVLLYCCGAAIPIALFYGMYCAVEKPAAVWHDINLMLSFTPRYVASLDPAENLAAWTTYIRGQANTWPLLLFAIVALFVPAGAGSPKHAILFLKAAIIAVLVFWIFFYPKKAYTIAVPLLPAAYFVSIAARPERWPRPLCWALIACLVANAALVGRYHWRLLHKPTGMEELAPVARELERQGVLRAHAAVMGKLWLLFALPRDVTLWDVTAFPVILGKASGLAPGIDQAIRLSDAVILEWQDGHWADDTQAEIAAHLVHAGWRQVPVATSRYFQPAELKLFLPR